MKLLSVKQQLVTCGSDLFHKEVDVHLCIVHDKMMRVFDPLQCFIHCLAVDVDPASSSRGQKSPESHTKQVKD